MGCNAAKNVAVAPIESHENGNNGVAERNSHKTKPRSSKSKDTDPGEIENATVNNVQKAVSGMSFEITFDENEDGNEGKLPPKRILEADPNRQPVTLENIQEKLEEAEVRRQQILQQRVQSANLLKRQKNSEVLQSMDSDLEQSPNNLAVPKEHPKI